ncbi:DEAD/DEAH box helicase [Micromonospora craniellae]|uniref:DEAD/DEAH box helicase n=1 Tax=Micromonospora craniellae TaxID=2294034 RepID=A0A372FR02_9ACTN|nr:DEAD/DEAH box helicase [Micromonospora craniellae]QOC90887.1 DEAD/DEAH box helicase [Micromonospora craniellae]RFS43161.1 DEAD/DEAH box helicase [Micromonospora craniellae]
MAKLELTVAEAALYDLVGPRTFVRARQHLDRGDLVDVRWDPTTGRISGQLTGTCSGPVTAHVAMLDERITALEGDCACGQDGCAHLSAMALAMLSTGGPPQRDPVKQQKKKGSWESAVASLVRDIAPPEATMRPEQAGVGLQFEAVRPTPDSAGFRVGLRPVVPGRTGWVRSGISWSSLSYAYTGRSRQSERHRRLLGEIVRSAASGHDPYGYHYGGHRQTIFLDEIETRRIWDLLAEADEAGVPFVQPGKLPGPVLVGRRPVRLSVRVDRADGELALGAALSVDRAPIDTTELVLVGDPAHGVAWWGQPDANAPRPGKRALHLAPLDAAMSPRTTRALAGPPIRIPAAEEAQFFDRFYPDLLRQVEVIAAGPAVRLPAVGPDTLAVTLTPEPGHRLRVTWEWHRVVGDRRHPEPLRAGTPGGADAHRERVLGQVIEVVAKPVAELVEPTPAGPQLTASTVVAGDALIRFLTDVVPRLADIDHVEVITAPDGTLPDYQETFDAPAITFTDGNGAGDHDWFDLSVQVSVGGEPVDFATLFGALAQDHQYLILPSGTYFALDRAEFRQLRELIAESRTLSDAPPGTVRVGRFQAGLWDELAELGEVTGQAAAWQQSVRALSEADLAVPHPVPTEVRAELRPYQQDGFRWLATLHDHGLGGVLADDMGLGKTLQALALICHARREQPFLVVCPASVVDNWAREAARFTPDLAVRAITQTVARRGVELAEAVSGAQVVVTSYTLFRLEYDDYRALDWAGLILDEAQFVKNAQSQAHRCAKLLPAPFKLAITGTPMENNLGELWALCSIASPGLLPRADRFTEYYRNPIEKERDADRLTQLRRRIRPLMLRRRKGDVAADLPPKQEQVLEIELDRKHRRVYQAYLQRERQKVLGLLGDLEKNRFEIFRSLTLLRQASLDVGLVDPEQSVPSTKLDVLAERVADLVAEGHRTLVFSQFTRFLDRARQRLEQDGIGCSYLDGSTRDRAAVIDEFKSGTNPVFLISLKAGGFGLNLTEADYCLLLDPWWNPAAENQAVDRVHRIGQTRNVMVYRLVAKDTIEEKVMALKARKAELFDSVLDGGEFASAQLTVDDIRNLLE